MSYAGTTSEGQLSLTDPSHTTQFSFVGSYASDQFHVASDGHGGTLLTCG